jgi:glycosyltransferase involved in cell wall biosynthesis
MFTVIIMANIKSLLSLLDNNYKDITSIKKQIDGCSIIIPFYNRHQELLLCLESLGKQKIPFKFEVIIIDDGSTIPLNIKGNPINQKLDINVFRFSKNFGPAIARNIGIAKAKYSLLIFLDSDMVVPRNFLFEHFRCHQKSKKEIITVSFRKHLLLDWRKKGINFNMIVAPSYKSDFRYKKFVPFKWKKEYPFFKKDIFGKTYYILSETNDFLNFGYGRSVGIWMLPNMVVSASIAVAATKAIEVGGFDCRFKSAWFEDVHFGAKLICAGVKIMPVKNVTAIHLVRKGQEDKKESLSVLKNIELYYRLIREKVKNESEDNFIKKLKKYESKLKKIS